MIATIVQVLMFVLPWSVRRSALSLLFGYQVDRTAPLPGTASRVVRRFDRGRG